MTQDIPEGWYQDPQHAGPGRQRWWNGRQWTAHTRVLDLPPPAPAAPGGDPAAREGSAGQPDLVQRFRSLPRQLPDGTPVPEVPERLGAHVIDVLLVWVAASVVSGGVGLGLGLTDRYLLPTGLPWFLFDGWLDAVVLAVFWVGYQLACRGSGGATVGKRMLRLRVRPLEAEGPLSTGQVLRRAVLGGGAVLFLMFPGAQLLGLALLGFDGYRMTQDALGRPWHDQVAGTAVVKAPPS